MGAVCVKKLLVLDNEKPVVFQKQPVWEKIKKQYFADRSFKLPQNRKKGLYHMKMPC